MDDKTTDNQSDVRRAVEEWSAAEGASVVHTDLRAALRAIATSIERQDAKIAALEKAAAPVDAPVDAPAPTQIGPPWDWTPEQRAGLVAGATVEWSALNLDGNGNLPPTRMVVRYLAKNFAARGDWSVHFEGDCGDIANCNPASLRPPKPVESAPVTTCARCGDPLSGVSRFIEAELCGDCAQTPPTKPAREVASASAAAPVAGEGEAIIAALREFLAGLVTSHVEKNAVEVTIGRACHALATYRAAHPQKGFV